MKSSLKEISSALTLGGLESSSLSIQEKKFIQSRKPSGVTLFTRNIPNPEKIEKLQLITELQECSSNDSLPLIIAVDQEGGTVARLKNSLVDPGPSLFLAKGETHKEALKEIKKLGETLGKSLLESGFNVNFAPSVDITTSAKASECAINTRSFGYTKEDVIVRARSFIQGLQSSGISGCIKHFPGLGGIKIDTHKLTAVAPYSEKDLWEKHIEPFIALKDEVKMVLVSHCIYPNICPYEATRSHKIMTEILRKKLGFEGLIVSDDLGMNAVTNAKTPWEDYIIQSISAGCDLLLICKGLKQWEIACHVIELEAKKNPSFKKRVLESYERIQNFRQQLSSC